MLPDIDPEILDVETALEIVIAWLELYRDTISQTRDPEPILDSLKAVIKEPLLWLARDGIGVRIVHSDFELKSEVLDAMCAPNGPYERLARIRFSHYFTEENDTILEMRRLGHHTLRRMVAVPIFVGDSVAGCLAAGGNSGTVFEKSYGMLLSFAAIILSMMEGWAAD